MEEVGKEEVRVLTSRVAELEDVNKQLTGRLQQEQAAHEVSTHLKVVMMCMYIQMAIVGILESHLFASFEFAHFQLCICFCLKYAQIILHITYTCVVPSITQNPYTLCGDPSTFNL